MEKVCKTSDVPRGSMKGFTIKGKPILIANVGGKFYAMDAICSHMHGYLPSGKLEGNIITCPVHGAQFDVTTGKVVKNVPGLMKLATGRNSNDLRVYAVAVKNESIFINA
jgi:3-phenylpropionate/trans-cinnamate dioxygenase ferredoxin subunit